MILFVSELTQNRMFSTILLDQPHLKNNKNGTAAQEIKQIYDKSNKGYFKL